MCSSDLEHGRGERDQDVPEGIALDGGDDAGADTHEGLDHDGDQ